MATRGQKLLAAGTTILVSEPLLTAVAHQGPVGAIVGLGLGAVAYFAVEDLERVTGRELPSLSAPKLASREAGQPSLAYRIFNGKSTRGDESHENTEVVNGEVVFPKYREDETLRLGQAIDKEALTKLIMAYQQDRTRRIVVPGRRFEPHIDDLFGKSMIIAAVPGSGKSMLIGLFVEQAGECDAPVIVLDHKGEYTGIAELAHLSGLLAGGESARRKAEKLGVSYFALTLANADAFVEMVISQHLQAIVMLPSYGTWLGRASIVAEVAQALMRYSARQIEAGQEVLPCLVMLDEAQLYIPERVELLPPEARKNGEVLESLYNAFFDLATAGRSNGYTIGFATQSLTYIGKWAIKGCQIKVLMRHAEHNDLEMIHKIVGKVATREEMETLPPGVGVVVGFTQKPIIVQFDTRQSRDASSTPGIGRLREARGTEPEAERPNKVGDLTLPELVALLNSREIQANKDEQNEPYTDDLEDEEPPENVTALVAGKRDTRRKAEDIDLKVAVALWNGGFNSRAKLAKALDIAENQADKLMVLMDVKPSDGRMDG